MSDLGVGFIDILPRSDKFTSVLSTQMTAGLSKVSTGLKGTSALTAGLTAGIVGLGAVAVGAITKGIAATQEWAGEVRSLQRVTGLAAEDASKLAAAGGDLGISVNQLNTGFGLLAKNIENGSTNFDKYNIATKDATGNSLPFLDILGNISDKFATLEKGPEQAAFAMNVFGRSGKALIPVLQRGSDGLQELYDKAQAAGLVMDQSTLDASKKLTIAQRELGDAVKGASIQIGTKFVPAMTSLTTSFTTFIVKVGPIVADVLTPVADALVATADGVQGILDLIPGTDSALAQVGATSEKSAAFTEVWTQKWADLNDEVAAGTITFDEAVTKFNDWQDRAGAFGENLDQTGRSVDSLGRSMQNFAGLTKSALSDLATSVVEPFQNLGPTIKDTFNLTARELQTQFDQLLKIAVRWKADVAELLALKPKTFGLNATDMSAFENYLLTQAPAVVDAFVRGTISQQQKIVDDWKRKVGVLNQTTNQIKNADIKVTADTSDAKYTIDNFIAAEGMRVIEIGVIAKQQKAEGGPVFARGGRVGFSSGGSTDTIPAMLSPGEFVMRRAAVEKIGMGNLERMNAGGAVGTSRGSTKMDGALRIYDWRNGLATLDAELGWEDAVRTR